MAPVTEFVRLDSPMFWTPNARHRGSNGQGQSSIFVAYRMLEAVRGSSKYCGCRFSLRMFSLGSQSVVLWGRRNPRPRIDDLTLLHHSGCIKKESYIDTSCDGNFQILEVGLPNLLPSSVQLKEKSVSPKAFGSHVRFDGPQLFHCFEPTKSLSALDRVSGRNSQCARTRAPSFTTGHLVWKECNNSQMSRGHKSTWAKVNVEHSLCPSLPDFSASPEVSNQTVALTQPCQMTKFMGAVSFVIEGLSAALITTNYLCQPFQLLEVINPAQSSTTRETLTSWELQG